MSRAALRLLGILLCAAGARAASAPQPLPTLRMGKTQYVRAVDIAERLNLRLRWIALRQLELADSAHKIELPSESREARVDGLVVDLGDPTVVRGGALYLSKIDFERRLIPLLRPALAGPPPPAPRIIAIDPGHGGYDPGKENSRLRLQEKVLTLDVGLRLRKLLEAAGYKVVMTRVTDRPPGATKEADTPLRPEIANLAHADLFISIHFNAGPPADTRTHGTTVFTFAPSYQRSSDSWSGAIGDNSEPNREHPTPSPANRNDLWNVVLAHAVHRELLTALHTQDLGERLSHLAVLRPLNCPGILVESAYLSNDAEAERVATPAFRQQIAEAMAAGIRAYCAELDSLQPPAPAPAFPLPAPKNGSGAPAQPSAPAAPVLLPPQRPS
jgi:N-acetylmuramoyl-L-alanine amidase